MQRIVSPSISFRSSLSTIIISSNLGFIDHLNFTHRILNASVNTFHSPQCLRLSKSYLRYVSPWNLSHFNRSNKFCKKKTLTVLDDRSVSTNYQRYLDTQNMPILFLCEKKNTNNVYKVVRTLYTAYTLYKILQTLYTAKETGGVKIFLENMERIRPLNRTVQP